jgi:hypothetical protein
MLKDLILGFRQFGGDPATWDAAQLHLSITGSASTQAVIMSPFARALTPAVNDFCAKAAAVKLHGKSYEFVLNHFRPTAPWDYLEVGPVGDGDNTVRFDCQYRERLMATQVTPVIGNESIYARVIRVGGEKPPTAKLDVMGHGPMTVDLKGEAAVCLAKKLGENLYETVNLEGTASWDPHTFKLLSFAVEGINEHWQDVSLAAVIADSGGVLPVKLTVKSESALIRERKSYGRKG